MEPEKDMMNHLVQCENLLDCYDLVKALSLCSVINALWKEALRGDSTIYIQMIGQN